MFEDSENSDNVHSETASDGLADTESYRELLHDKETIGLLKKEIQSIVDLRLREMGISSEWQGIPRKTYEKSVHILDHQSALLKKTIPNFDNIKKKLGRVIDKKCEKLAGPANNDSQKPISKQQKEIYKTKKNLKSRNLKGPKEFKNKDKNKQNQGIRPEPKPRQNIVKIVCRPKPIPRKSKDKFILPPRRSSVTISNPVLFETQDSSSDSEDFDTKASIPKITKRNPQEIKTNTEQSIVSSIETKKQNKKQVTKNKHKDEIVTSDSNGSISPKRNKNFENKKLQPKIKSIKKDNESVVIPTFSKPTSSLVHHNSNFTRTKNTKPKARISFKDDEHCESSEKQEETNTHTIQNKTKNHENTEAHLDSDSDVLESSSDENIVKMFKKTEKLDIKKSSKLNEARITQVLPKMKKPVSENIGNRFKRVLFDVDND